MKRLLLALLLASSMAYAASPPIGGSTSNVTADKANKSTTITAGTGLTGGGDLSANRTITLKITDSLSTTDSTTAASATSVKSLNDTKSPLAGSSSITTVGTLSSGNIPYSLLSSVPNFVSASGTPVDGCSQFSGGVLISTGLACGSSGGGGSGTVAAGTAGQFAYYNSNGTTVAGRTLLAADIPTLNQNTSGNAGTATALAANPTDCTSGQYANAIVANGNLTCAQVSAAQISGLVTTLGTPGSDTNFPTEKAVRTAIAAIPSTTFRGALVYTPGSANNAVIPWSTESGDTDSIHSTTTNTSRMVVPSGVTKVELSFANQNGGSTNAIWKNGEQTYVGAVVIFLNSGYGFGISPVLDVTAGDYFELWSGGVQGGDTSGGTWFQMKIIQ